VEEYDTSATDVLVLNNSQEDKLQQNTHIYTQTHTHTHTHIYSFIRSTKYLSIIDMGTWKSQSESNGSYSFGGRFIVLWVSFISLKYKAQMLV
jgi:hypothetical protein